MGTGPLSHRTGSSIAALASALALTSIATPAPAVAARPAAAPAPVGAPAPAVAARPALAAPSYDFQFAGEGSGAGRLATPLAIAAGPSGAVWIADRGNERIEEFGADGRFIEAIGYGVSDGQARAEICTRDCRAGVSGSAPGQFDDPRGVAVDRRTGAIYVADAGDDRVEEFAPDGAFTMMFGASGAGPGQLNSPNGLTIDAAGDVWVADTRNDRVEEYAPDGRTLQIFGAPGNGAGELQSPQDVALWRGRVLVADWGNGRIQEFSRRGAYLGQVGSPGPGDGSLASPTRLAVDPHSGQVYVADAGNERVQVFAPDGTALATFGSAGTQEGQFEALKAVALGPEGTIYTADGGDGRIQAWVPAARALATQQSGSAAAVRFRPENVLSTPIDTAATLTNAAGEDELSPPCVFPGEVAFSSVCEAHSFPAGDQGGAQGPVVVASRRLTGMQAGETIDAAADIELSNTSAPAESARNDPVAVSLQLVLASSPVSVSPGEGRVLAELTGAQGAQVSDYYLEHHAALVARGRYTVRAPLEGPLYLDAVVRAAVPAGSTFGQHRCVASPGEAILDGSQALCPVESDARFSTLSVQRFQPAGPADTPLVVEEAAGPGDPGAGESTTFPIAPGNGLDYPYTSVWESGEMPKLNAAHCPDPSSGAGQEGEREACAFIEAHADLGVTLADPRCSALLGGRFFLTQDPEVVAQSALALQGVQEALALGREPEYSLGLGSAALAERFPAYAAYESSSVLLGGEASTNVTGVGVAGSVPIHGGLSISATVPVPRGVLLRGARAPWYLALELAPEQRGCADSLTVDGAASHAEAIVFRPPGPGERGWGEVSAAPLAAQPAGTALTETAAPVVTDALTVRSGDIVDVGADASVRGPAEAASQATLTGISGCLAIDIGAREYPLGTCSLQDLSSLQGVADVFHSASFTVPAGVAPGTPARLSYTLAAGPSGAGGPARLAGPGDLDVEVYEAPVLASGPSSRRAPAGGQRGRGG